MEIGYSTVQEQSQIMSQNQIQSLQILAMDNMELNEYLQNEYLENPLLEYVSASEAGREDRSGMESMSGTGATRVSDHITTESYKAWNEGSKEKEYDVASENPLELKYFLLDQINQLKYTVAENKVMEFLIDCLDPSGFFTMSTQDVARMTKTSVETVEKCLDIMSNLKPDGIFAPDLAHCLIHQLEVLGEDDEYIHDIILNHLEDVANGKISSISRKLNLPTTQVRKYIAAIKRLNPRPLMGIVPGRTEYITPDIVFSYKDQQWSIELNDKWMGDYKLSSYYMNLMQTATDKELLEYFRRKMESTRFIIRSVEQRRMTILRISQAILDWQMEYFNGHGPLKPMTMADIAEKIDMHVSTVSRGIKGKYVQCPRGTLKVKDLFSASALQSQDGAETPDVVKTKIKELIDNENHEKPYSDQEIAEILSARNICISRRTVAKYRKEMCISTTYERKYSE